MSNKVFLISISLILILSSCSNSVNYSAAHIKQTTGRYLYNADELIEVYYKDQQLFLKWKGASKIKPVVLDENTFFVPDMYKKLRFVKEPATNTSYLAIVSENDDKKVTFAYPKVASDYRTPRMHLNDGAYDEAIIGYQKLQLQDSTKTYIEESEINTMGYELLRKKSYDKAIRVFEMNVTLYPNSANAYDSLGEAYVISGDSINGFVNFRKAFKLNPDNERAKAYVEGFKPSQLLPDL